MLAETPGLEPPVESRSAVAPAERTGSHPLGQFRLRADAMMWRVAELWESIRGIEVGKDVFVDLGRQVLLRLIDRLRVFLRESVRLSGLSRSEADHGVRGLSQTAVQKRGGQQGPSTRLPRSVCDLEHVSFKVDVILALVPTLETAWELSGEEMESGSMEACATVLRGQVE